MRINQKFYRVEFNEGENHNVFFCLGYNLDIAEKYAAIEIFSNPINNIQINHNNPLSNKEELQLLGSTCITERSNRAYEVSFLSKFFLDNFKQEVTIKEL